MSKRERPEGAPEDIDTPEAKRQRVEDAAVEALAFMPSSSPGLSDAFPGLLDEVAFTEVTPLLAAEDVGTLMLVSKNFAMNWMRLFSSPAVRAYLLEKLIQIPESTDDEYLMTIFHDFIIFRDTMRKTLGERYGRLYTCVCDWVRSGELGTGPRRWRRALELGMRINRMATHLAVGYFIDQLEMSVRCGDYVANIPPINEGVICVNDWRSYPFKYAAYLMGRNSMAININPRKADKISGEFSIDLRDNWRHVRDLKTPLYTVPLSALHSTQSIITLGHHAGSQSGGNFFGHPLIGKPVMVPDPDDPSVFNYYMDRDNVVIYPRAGEQNGYLVRERKSLVELQRLPEGATPPVAAKFRIRVFGYHSNPQRPSAMIRIAIDVLAIDIDVWMIAALHHLYVTTQPLGGASPLSMFQENLGCLWRLREAVASFSKTHPTTDRPLTPLVTFLQSNLGMQPLRMPDVTLLGMVYDLYKQYDNPPNKPGWLQRIVPSDMEKKIYWKSMLHCVGCFSDRVTRIDPKTLNTYCDDDNCLH